MKENGIIWNEGNERRKLVLYISCILDSDLHGVERSDLTQSRI